MFTTKRSYKYELLKICDGSLLLWWSLQLWWFSPYCTKNAASDCHRGAREWIRRHLPWVVNSSSTELERLIFVHIGRPTSLVSVLCYTGPKPEGCNRAIALPKFSKTCLIVRYKYNNKLQSFFHPENSKTANYNRSSSPKISAGCRPHLSEAAHGWILHLISGTAAFTTIVQ